MKQLDRYFHLTEKGATLAGEVRGGCTTFFATMYLVAVIPGILAALGLSVFSVVQSKKYGYGMVDGHKQHYSAREIAASFKGAILPLTTPLFILGSITFSI